MKCIIMLIFLGTALMGCDIQAIDYAVGDVRLVEKMPLIVADKPAIKLVIENKGDGDASDIVVFIKAKKEQVDLEELKVGVEFLKSGARAEKTAIFRHIGTHDEYDLLTYAVTFTPVE